MSIATDITRILSAKSDIHTAIIGKGVDVPNTTKIDAYSGYIDQISQGTPEDCNDPLRHRVRFIDYDGTILKLEYVNDGESVTPPSSPVHAGLTFQGWNYAASHYNNVVADLEIGALYITTDGKTHLLQSIPFREASSGNTSYVANVHLTSADGVGTINIDWGDGSAQEISTGVSGEISFLHTFAAQGDYDITVWATDGGTYAIGATGYSLSNEGCTEVHIGNNVYKIFRNAFSVMYALKYITIPYDASMTVTYSYLFDNCRSLRCAILPYNNPSFGDYTFYNCVTMRRVSLPYGITKIYSNFFKACRSLDSIILPDSVTSVDALGLSGTSAKQRTYIGYTTLILRDTMGDCYMQKFLVVPSTVISFSSYCMDDNYAVQALIFQGTTPPSGQANWGLSTMSPVFKIFVPDSAVDAYKAAYTAHAFRIYPVSQFDYTQY